MNEQETITDIVKKIRAEADYIEETARGSLKAGENYDGIAYTESDLESALDLVESKRKEADRLEAAYKRERGDCAKLREAVCEILSYIESFHKYITPGKGKKLTALFAVADTIRNNARAALAAPPRNCDVYNNESCRMAYHLHGDGLMTMQAFADWLFAPATEQEGGAK